MSQDGLRTLDERLKHAIQTLFIIQSNVHNYAGPETQQQLAQHIRTLQPQLAALSDEQLPEIPQITTEIIDYVDSGRNPDIYTREFVELVQRTNAYLKGKSEALAEFRDVLAEEIVRGFGPEVEPLVGLAVGRARPGEEGARDGKGNGGEGKVVQMVNGTA